jgi:hypothetical protein
MKSIDISQPMTRLWFADESRRCAKTQEKLMKKALISPSAPVYDKGLASTCLRPTGSGASNDPNDHRMSSSAAREAAAEVCKRADDDGDSIGAAGCSNIAPRKNLAQADQIR